MQGNITILETVRLVVCAKCRTIQEYEKVKKNLGCRIPPCRSTEFLDVR